MQAWFDQILTNDDPAWLVEQRRAAWKAALELPMPRRDEEDWRRTDLRGLHLEDFTPARVEEVLEPPAWYHPQEPYGGWVLTHDSALLWEGADLPDGVIFTSLARAAREHPEWVEPYLHRLIPVRFNRLVAMAAALWQGGAFLYVPRGVQLQTPLRLDVSLETPGRTSFSRVLVVLEEGASVHLVRSWASRTPDAPGFSSDLTEIVLKENAQFDYYDLQQWNRRTWDFSVQRVHLGRHSRLHWWTGLMGGRLSKSYREVYLKGPGGDARMHALFLARERQHLDIQTYQAHEAEHTTSNLLYKGILTDKARTVFRGMIRVEPEGQRTDAYQTNRNLLLSPDARADSIPGLEIEADDVRCSHSAASSSIDPEQMFYLQSRGIREQDARTMLIYGFVDDVLAQIKLESVRQTLESSMAELLGE